MSTIALLYYCYLVPLLEVIEIGAGWWFQYTYDDKLASDSAVMRSNFVWLLIACVVLLLKRIAIAFINEDSKCLKDRSSYKNIHSRFSKARKAADSDDESNKEHFMTLAKAVYMPYQWISWCVSLANIIIIGIAHLDEGITAASATTQIPSWYICVWTVVAHFLWNYSKIPKEDVPTSDEVL